MPVARRMALFRMKSSVVVVPISPFINSLIAARVSLITIQFTPTAS